MDIYADDVDSLTARSKSSTQSLNDTCSEYGKRFSSGRKRATRGLSGNSEEAQSRAEEGWSRDSDLLMLLFCNTGVAAKDMTQVFAPRAKKIKTLSSHCAWWAFCGFSTQLDIKRPVICTEGENVSRSLKMKSHALILQLLEVYCFVSRRARQLAYGLPPETLVCRD